MGGCLKNFPDHDWRVLLDCLQSLGAVTLAYSGGLDSRFLAHAAQVAGLGVELVHMSGPHVPQADTRLALAWARVQGFLVRLQPCDPLALPAVAAGTPQRCYACKHTLFTSLLAQARWPVCDGSNASDAATFRPGRQALAELGVCSPLADAGLTKDRIHALAREQGLWRPDQPAKACLLTRLPYGMSPDPALLALLERGEEIVEQSLRVQGLAECAFRLRILRSECFELHLGLDHCAVSLSCELSEKLCSLGLGHIVVRAMPRLNGFFDRAD